MSYIKFKELDKKCKSLLEFVKNDFSNGITVDNNGTILYLCCSYDNNSDEVGFEFRIRNENIQYDKTIVIDLIYLKSDLNFSILYDKIKSSLLYINRKIEDKNVKDSVKEHLKNIKEKLKWKHIIRDINNEIDDKLIEYCKKL